MSKSIISKFPSNDNNNMYDGRRGPQYFVPMAIIITLLLIGFFWLGSLMISIPDYFGEMEELKGEPIPKVIEVEEKEVEPEPEKELVIHLTDDDILAAVAMSEAGNQDLLGKAFVILTVLNRCDYYGLTVEEVVNAPNQYSYPYYGIITAECYEAVGLARNYREIAPDIMWFRTKNYHNIGTPAFQWGDHYFSNVIREESNE